MSSEVATIAWLAASAQSAKELVTTTLCFENFQVLPKVVTDEDVQCGSYVEIVAGRIEMNLFYKDSFQRRSEKYRQ